ncbi:TIGR00269 family protein [archaeon SCG-AAA382B04]|nr:TIGR00269 family protein [archaeon SCG-AAA382B04]
MILCDKCDKEAIIKQDYSGSYLCKDHFHESVESKIKKHIRKNYSINDGEKIGIALSGGKDSIVVLHILNDIFGEWKDLELVSLTIDEGISGYREEAINFAKKDSKKLSIKNHIFSFKEEIGYSLDGIGEKVGKEKTCRYCGIIRRWLLNKKAKELDLDKIAVGHNLDDESQSALMNFLRGETERLETLDTDTSYKKGFVPRIKPLREIPEKEVGLYAKTRKDMNAHFASCPYSDWALRGEIRDILNNYEKNHPGAKYSILRGVEKTAPRIKEVTESANLDECKLCGEPSNNKICQACKLRRKLRKK